MILNMLILSLTVAVFTVLAFSRSLARSSDWKATLTPLASIMGSGFLVSAPLLAGTVGNLAVFCMAGLLVLAYGAGAAIRFNIRHFEPIENDSGFAQDVALLSRLVLVGAYFISISYYLQLVAAFVLQELGLESQFAAHAITSTILVCIGLLGIWRGLNALEAVEKYAVSLNLAMISALLLGLAWHNGSRVLAGDWELPELETSIDWHDLRVLLGLLIVVQGFETSRYLGSAHSADQRIATMRRAQLLSAGIYLVFIGLIAVLFTNDAGADVTAIVSMTKPVAIVLPLLLVIAAVGSQFSAAVADNSGAAGLIGDLVRRRIHPRCAYLLIMLVALALTWETNVTQIIAYASRAFALYYTLQCVVALSVSRSCEDLSRRKLHVGVFAILAAVCFLVFAFGLPVES